MAEYEMRRGVTSESRQLLDRVDDIRQRCVDELNQANHRAALFGLSRSIDDTFIRYDMM